MAVTYTQEVVVRGYDFEKPIDPEKPLDPDDPPPEAYRHVDTSDFRRALFGFPSSAIERCREWEEREMQRYGYVLKLKEIMPRSYRRVFVKA